MKSSNQYRVIGRLVPRAGVRLSDVALRRADSGKRSYFVQVEYYALHRPLFDCGDAR